MKTSSYITWAKRHHQVRYNLASSGVPAPSLETLGAAIDDFSLTAEHEEGWAPLIDRVAARYDVDAGQVALAQGTSMANHLVCALLLEPGDHVLLEHPCYEPLHLVPSFFHAEIDFFERPRDDDFALSPERIEEKLTDRTRLVILSNLHNPTGAHTTPSELEPIARLAHDKDFHVLLDEVYLEWVFDETDEPDRGERTAASISPKFVTTRSLTKAYGLDAIRVGWILGEADIAERVRRLMDLYSVKMVHASERLAARALDRADAILTPAKQRLDENRALVDAFVGEHDDLSWWAPRAGSVGLVYWTGSIDALVDELLRRDALVTPGKFFGVPDAFRIGYGMATAELSEGLSRLDEALALARAQS